MIKIIKPTVGRVVLFWPVELSVPGFVAHADQPCRADICYVYDDRLINISVNDHNGHPHRFNRVPLIQDGGEVPTLRAYCTWMPYQIGQAKKEDQHPAMAALTLVKTTPETSAG